MTDPPVPQAPPLSAVIAGHGDQIVTVAQLVTLLEHVREEILADAQKKSDRLHRQVSEEVAAISALSNRILTSVCTSTLDTRSTRSRGSSSGRRSAEPPPSLDNIDIFQSPDVGASEYLQFLMLLTVMAFIANVPNATLWVSTATHTHMLRFMPILRKVSGFSLIFFSVRSTDAKTARKRTPMGQARSLLVKWTLARKVLLSREAIEKLQATPPAWLQSFGNHRATQRRISEILHTLDYADDTRGHEGHHRNSIQAPSSVISEIPGVPPTLHGHRPNKRRRENADVEVDPVRDSQIVAVRAARKKLLRALSHCRTDVRKKLFTSFLFVLERIWTYETPTVASENGYAVIFADSEEDDDVPIVGPGMPETSKWSIPLALKRGPVTDEIVRDTNLRRFIALQKSFPGLAVKLKYKIAVRRNPNDEPDGLPEFHDPDLALNESVDVSLHSVAASCLLGGSRASDFDEVLRTSELSLRAIHIIALGLRGLLKKAVEVDGSGPKLSDVEKFALGDVSARLLQRGDQEVTAMFGGGTKEPGEGSETRTDLEKLRRSKLEMTWAEYHKRIATEASMAEHNLSSDACRSESDNSGAEDNWVNNAGI